ncbi:hypothetical protein ACK3SF_00560 [Candidatus Nanosalina sp. VS9-1]|uniref:hypothetical protein n=1 Tax=Candidatus Nanosalina sp. VS9-1 TaxID=3388566 RepID=UPI0039DF71E6
MASIADGLFFPIAAVATAAFIAFVVAIIPQATADLTTAANRQTAQLEVHSMMSTLFHGQSYSADDGTPITDYQTISYLICGKNPDNGGWLDIGNQEYLDTGEIELASHYEIRISTPDLCGNSKWNPPEGYAGVDSGQTVNSYYDVMLPVRGGETARIRMVYGFD